MSSATKHSFKYGKIVLLLLNCPNNKYKSTRYELFWTASHAQVVEM